MEMSDVKFPSMKYLDNMSAADRKKYAGYWIVVLDDKVVHHSKNMDSVRKIVAMYDSRGDTPVVQYIYEGNPVFLL